MNRNEAKAYALDELGLDRDDVRQFGNLSRTQTWLDAIAAQASGGIAAFEATSEPTETEGMSLDALADASATIVLAWEATPEDSFITFWEAEPEPVVPQTLDCLPELDEAWNEPESVNPAPMVYPVVILLMMLWALVQVLLLGGKVLCWLLSEIASGLDAMAQERLQRQRESNLALSPGLIFASP